MLKHVADLSDSNEYFLIWAGGTNARPWGAKADAYSLFPEFEKGAAGLAITADLSGGGHSDGATTTFTITVAAAESLSENEWRGATFRMGTKTGAALGYGSVVTNDAIAAGGLTGSIKVSWVTGLSGGTGGAADDCYVVAETLGVRKRSYYPEVRVLTPYQPVSDDITAASVPYPDPTATGGRAVTVPLPHVDAATTFAGLGLLLPLSFDEGINGWGISDVDDSAGGGAHVISGVTGSVWTYGTAAGVADHLNGGYVVVDWELASVPKRSWAPITDSTTTTFTVGTWLGDGDPGSDGIGARYTAWVPYIDDSPYAYLPGEGFTYPNHDMMPCSGSASGAAVHNRPRGISGYAYGDTFGAMLVAASRLSAAIGKRINVVNLGVTDSLLGPGGTLNSSGFDGTLGWWDADSHGSWAPNQTTAIYQRLDDLLTSALPDAITSEGSTKPTKCLGIVFAHGEADALETGARQHYGVAQASFVKKLRTLLDTLSYNPYQNGAKVPVVHPRIAYLPNALDGSYDRDSDRGGGTVTIAADTDNLVNSAIEENTAADEFSDSVDVDDLPRLSTDPSIYSGVGEAELGARIGDALVRLADHGLSFGSTSLASTQTRTVDICNLALSHVGDAGQITSLDDGSEQALLCKRFLPEVRDELLQTRQWGFALRRRQLVPIRKPEPRLHQNWEFCYALPEEALNAFAVIPPVDEVGSGDFDYTQVTAASYQTDFVANDGSGLVDSESDTTPRVQAFSEGVTLGPDSLLTIQSGADLAPQPYSIEQSPYGHRYIYTNQEQATLRYTARVVNADLFSPAFASALASALAARLASVMIKGKEGEAVAARMMQTAAGYLRMASVSDANQQRPSDSDRPYGFVPDHLAHR